MYNQARYLIVFICFSIIILGAHSQTCEDANTSLQINEQCRPFVSGKVFVNTTDPLIIAGTIHALKSTPHNCALKVIELYCQTFHPICDFTYYPVLPPLPSPPCKSRCHTAYQACADYIRENNDVFRKAPNLIPLDCNVQDNGNDRWPDASAYYNISGIAFPVGCNTLSSDVEVSTVPDSCPYPMRLDATPEPDESPCPVRCPLPFYTDQEYKHYWTFPYIIAWISFWCLIYLTVSFFICKPKRQFPQNLFINLFISCIFLCIFIIIGEGSPEIACRNGQPSTQKYGKCGFQGSVMYYFALCASCWWFSIVINLYLMVYGKIKATDFWIVKYYYIFSYGLPFLGLIIALGLKGFGYYAPNIICFLPIDGPKEWIQYALYYVPTGIMVLIGGVLVVLIYIHLIKSYMSVSANVDKRNKSPYFKVATFAVSFLFIWGAIFSRMGVAKNKDVRESFLDFLICHINSFNMFNDEAASIASCGHVPKVQPNKNILQTQYVAMTIHGVTCFVLFCYDIELHMAWKELYMEVKKKLFGSSSSPNPAARTSTSSAGNNTTNSPFAVVDIRTSAAL